MEGKQSAELFFVTKFAFNKHLTAMNLSISYSYPQ